MEDGNIKDKMLEKHSKCAEKWGVRHVQVLLMLVTTTILFMAKSCISIAIIAMADSNKAENGVFDVFDWNKEIQDYIISSYFWGYFVMQLPAGLLEKRFGAKVIMTAALVSNAVISALTPLGARLGGWYYVCGLRSMLGLAQACITPSIFALIGAWLPSRERTSLSAIIYGGPKVGMIVGVPLCGVLTETKYGWPLIFYLMAALNVIVVVFWWKFTSSTPREHPMISCDELDYIQSELKVSDSKSIPWKQILSCKEFWAIAISHLGFNTLNTFLLFEIPSFMKKALGISLRTSATLSGFLYVGTWMSSILSSAVTQKLINSGHMKKGFLRKLCNSICFYGVGVGLIAMTVIGKRNTTMSIVTLVLCLCAEGFSSAGLFVVHLDMSPNLAGVLVSVTSGISCLGAILVPIFTGYIVKDNTENITRWNIVFWSMAAICFITNTVYLIMGSSKKQPWDDPSHHHPRKQDSQEQEEMMKKIKKVQEN